MKSICFIVHFVIAFCLNNIVYAGSVLTGAGSTFVVPIYTKWASEYYKKTGNKVNYQGIGSVGGIRQIILRTIDFCASDTALTEEEIQKEDLFQFPTLIGGIVPIVNIPGISSGKLVLNGEILSEIYLGKIKNWNDKKIIRLNQGLNIPKQNIVVLHRSDGSGTTFVFTKYLSEISEEWKNKVGFGSLVKWPLGVGGKGNEGMSVFVQRISGAIGYVEYAYVKQNNLNYTRLISADKEIVEPSEFSFYSAVKNVGLKEMFLQDLLNKRGKNTWPITSTTFILLHTNKENTEKIKLALDFFSWVYKNGSDQAYSLGYAMLPNRILKDIQIAWKKNI